MLEEEEGLSAMKVNELMGGDEEDCSSGGSDSDGERDESDGDSIMDEDQKEYDYFS